MLDKGRPLPSIRVFDDAAYATGWPSGPGYYSSSSYTTKVFTEEDLQEYLAHIEAQVKVPLIFAVYSYKIAAAYPMFPPATMQKFGWEPVLWKESCHNLKVPVQLYMRRLDKPWPNASTVRPPSSVSYSTVCTPASGVGGLGCSLQAFVAPPKYDLKGNEFLKTLDRVLYSGRTPSVKSSKDMLMLLKLARPVAMKSILYLREEGFILLAKTPFFQYWGLGNPGICSKEACKY